MRMDKLKIFQADEMFWVLTRHKENVLKILIDEEMVDEDITEDDINIAEVNYNKCTWQPIETLKNILKPHEIEHIKNILTEKKEIMYEKDGVKYFCSEDYCDLGYQAVRLSYKQIIENPKILSEFEINSIIATTMY